MSTTRNLESIIISPQQIMAVSEEEVRRTEEELSRDQLSLEKDIEVGDLNAKLLLCVDNPVLGSENVYGMALGGMRAMDYREGNPSLDYDSRLEKGRHDKMILSRAMSFKFGIMGVMASLMYEKGEITEAQFRSFLMGGGKSVLFFDDKREWTKLLEDDASIQDMMKRKLMNYEVGKILDSLEGRYVVGEDMNTTEEDMAWISHQTPYVSCQNPEIAKDWEGMIRGTGNPSLITSLGVYYSIRGLAEPLFGTPHLDRLTIAIEGVGNVGFRLAELLYKNHNLNLILTDRQHNKSEELKEKLEEMNPNGGRITVVHTDDFYTEETFQNVDIFSPNAGSETLDEEHVQFLCYVKEQYHNLQAVVGGANCQLETDEEGNTRGDLAQQLSDYGIYAHPDFVANLGGILAITEGFPGRKRTKDQEESKKLIKGARFLAKMVYDKSREGKLPHEAAEYLALQFIAAYKKQRDLLMAPQLEVPHPSY